MKLKKRHQQTRTQVRDLQQKNHRLALELRDARRRTDQVRRALDQLVENVEQVEQLSAALPKLRTERDPSPHERTVLFRRHHYSKGFLRPFDPLKEDPALESVMIVEKLLYRLQVDEVLQERLGDCLAFRVIHDGYKVDHTISLRSWLLTRGALSLPNVREQIALDVARAMVDTLARGPR